jgi:hypothetical protein
LIEVDKVLKEFGVTVDEIGPFQIYKEFAAHYLYSGCKHKVFMRFKKKIGLYNQDNETDYYLPAEELKKHYKECNE